MRIDPSTEVTSDKRIFKTRVIKVRKQSTIVKALLGNFDSLARSFKARFWLGAKPLRRVGDGSWH